MHPGLQDVANRAAYYATLRQTLLAETLEEQVGDHQIAGDLQEGTLQFVGAERTLTARCHLIASVAPGPKSMLWGWAHPQGGGEVAGRVKELGERFGITDLTSPELPFEAGYDIAATAAHLGHLAACVGVEATRISPYYTVNAGGGTRLVGRERGEGALAADHDAAQSPRRPFRPAFRRRRRVLGTYSL